MKFTRFGFGSGLMSRDLAGRVEVDAVHRACSELVNFELLQSGAVRRRNGSRWLRDLPGKPVAMQAFHWSDGTLAVVAVFDMDLIVLSAEGVQLFRCAYEAKGGLVRFWQINDLVIITNSKALPVRLTNKGGVYNVEEIVWSHYPLEGSFNQSFPLTFSGVNFRVADAWDFCERMEDAEENPEDPGEVEVEVDRKEYSFSFTQYVKQHGYRLNNEYIVIVQYNSGKGVYYWEKGSMVTAKSEAFYNFFPSVTVAGGMSYRMRFPGTWRGTIIVEVSTNNGSSWREKARLDGTKKELEETVEQDTLVRFKFYEYVNNLNWVEQPVMEVFRRMTVTPSGAGDVVRAEYDGKMFCVGDVLAVRHKISERKVNFSSSAHLIGLAAANLKTTSYAVGKRLYVDVSGVRKYWTCVKAWKADSTVPGGTDLDAWPSFFEPGCEFFRSVVSGAFEFGSKNGTVYNKWEVQTSSDGVRWETMITNNDETLPNTEVILTGDNDGVPLLMRCALMEHGQGVQVSSMNKWFKRKRFDFINYVRVESLKDDGTGQVTVLNDPDMFKVRHCWEWDFFAFREQNGFPSTCVLHAGRLVFGGTAGQPLTLWFSVVDDYFNFRTGDNTADSMLLTLCSSQQSALVWLASFGNALLCGTTSGEVAVRSIKADVLSSASAVAEQHSNCGSCTTSDVLMTTDAIMFMDRSGKRLRRISYSMDNEFYFARDMTVFSYGVLSGGLRSMVWQRAPEPVAWVVPDSGEYAGKLMGMLYNPDQELASWFCWDFGGDVAGLACTATGKAVDDLFLAVERDGAVTLEMMDWNARDYDCEGKINVPFKARLTTTQMDLPEFFGRKAVTPKISVLMDDVDLTGAMCGNGGGSMQAFSVSSGNGWVSVSAPTDGQFRRALALSIARGHGLILAGMVGND